MASAADAADLRAASTNTGSKIGGKRAKCVAPIAVFEFDFSCFSGFCLRQDELQDTVLEGGLDAVSVDVFRQGENPLVIPVCIIVINPLVPAMLVGGAVSADRQYAPFEADIDPFRRNSGYLRQHDDAVLGLIDVGRWHKYRPRWCALTGFPGGFPGGRRLLLDGSDFLGHDCTPSARVTQRGFRSSSADPPPAVAIRFPGSRR